MIRTQISMTDEQQEALRRLAAARRVSQAAVFRDALDTILAHQRRGNRIERARAAIGAYRSGQPNLAVDHDAALDDAFST
jgi:predicted transcriptional regulator